MQNRHPEIEALILKHRQLLERYLDSCHDLEQIDPEEDLELLGQVMEYRGGLLIELEKLFVQVQAGREQLESSEFDRLTADNDRLMQEIARLDEENRRRLQSCQQSIADELKQTALRTKAIGSYQAPVPTGKRLISEG